MLRSLACLTGLAVGAAGCVSADGARDADPTDAAAAETTMTAETAAEITTTAETVAACPLAANTTATTTQSAAGCALLERDTSACRATREGAGLSGHWLQFSCRVTLTVATDAGREVVRATADGQPDYPSFYFASDHACYAPYPDGQRNPNTIVAKAYTFGFPRVPDTTQTAMGGGIVGLALNGVPIFGNFAAPGDDIFAEALTFDRCGAHPQQAGGYHYHGEPAAISNDDARFIGVLRDGYPVYGRRDADGTMPTLDALGGHTGTTPDSAAAVYHYHLSEQVSTAAGTLGEHQWFLTRGTYRGTAATCTGCN